MGKPFPQYLQLNLAAMRALLCFLVCVLLVSCDKTDEQPAKSVVARTLLVYLGGDNNLSDENRHKVEALREAWNQPAGRLLVYSDERSRQPCLLELSINGEGKSMVDTVGVYEENNSADPQVLAGVLETMRRDYAAPSYGLIVFSHASGWLPEGTLLNPWKQPVQRKSIIIDGQREMDLKDFTAVIPDGLFDFIIFETCFMAGIEVVYELRRKADYIVASAAEMLSPGLTPLYGDIIPMLMESKPNLKGMAQRYFEYYDAQTGDSRSATISVVSTDGLEALASAAGTTLDPLMTGEVKTIQHFDRYIYRLFFDFGDAYSRVLGKEAFDALQEQLERCIVYKAATPSFIPGQRGFDIKLFSGLTVYIEQDGFPLLNEQYRELAWYRGIH